MGLNLRLLNFFFQVFSFIFYFGSDILCFVFRLLSKLFGFAFYL